MNTQQKRDYDYLRSNGHSHQIALERLGLAEAVTPLHPVYGNHTPKDFLMRFYGITQEQARRMIEEDQKLQRLVAQSEGRNDGYSRQRTLTTEDIEQASRMHAQGIEWAVIGKKWGMTGEALRKRVGRHKTAQ